jgi:type I restriction enzyme S subunit
MKMIPLSAVADIQLGKMLSPKAKTGRESYPYLRNQNVQWHRIDLKDLAKMDFSERERVKFELIPGDLLVCEGGEPGRCAVWTGALSDCFYQKAIHRVRPKENKASSEFLAYWLWFQCKYRTTPSDDSRTTIAHLPLNKLKQFLIPDIPISDQEAVVERLRPQVAAITAARSACLLQLDEIDRLPRKILANIFEA